MGELDGLSHHLCTATILIVNHELLGIKINPKIIYSHEKISIDITICDDCSAM